jgi:DNA topoisomerase-1
MTGWCVLKETRRILDRLVGYTLSPLLWKKIAWGLSAGRVQSVAVRLLVQRERERRAFRAGTWWDLKASLRHEGQGFDAVLTQLGGTRLATGKDFDEHSGKLTKPGEVVLLDQAQADSLRDRLLTKPWRVASVEEKPSIRRPVGAIHDLDAAAGVEPQAPALGPRDDADSAEPLRARLHHLHANRLGSSLEPGGDRGAGVHRATVRQRVSRAQATTLFQQGRAHPGGARGHSPAGSHFRTPEESGLAGIERDLYDLIWKRTVACQMADARVTSVIVQLEVEEAQFRASGKRIDFAGFLRAYVEGTDDPEAALEDQEVLLPALAVGDAPSCETLEALSHVTQPPARFTEATLVKELEADGVGRPSTYASVIGTILERGYAVKQGQALIPTFTAIAVTLLLEKHFPHLVDIKFTARMEQSLDDIAEGQADWLPYLREFYLGDDGLRHQTEVKQDSIDPAEARSITLQGLDATVRIGRFGPYIERQDNGSAIRVSVPESVPPADLNGDIIETLLREKKEGPTSLGEDPATAQPVYIRTGQYGPYVQLGDVTDEQPKPKRMSLPRGVKPEDVTLELALGLLALPRALGVHPESGARVLAGLGRFGPYIVHDQGKDGKDYRSIKGDDHVLTITLARALEMLAQPKQGRGRRSEPKPMRELGPHPDDQAVINLYDGRYGPYVKHGTVSASIPRGTGSGDGHARAGGRVDRRARGDGWREKESQVRGSEGEGRSGRGDRDCAQGRKAEGGKEAPEIKEGRSADVAGSYVLRPPSILPDGFRTTANYCAAIARTSSFVSSSRTSVRTPAGWFCHWICATARSCTSSCLRALASRSRSCMF